jgi:hypothetical protein
MVEGPLEQYKVTYFPICKDVCGMYVLKRLERVYWQLRIHLASFSLWHYPLRL